MQESTPNDIQKSEDYKNSNFLSRIIDTIRSTFFQTSKTLLTGKAQEQQKNIHKVLRDLFHIKTELKKKIKSELFKHVEKAIDPIAREGKRLQKLMACDVTNEDIKTTDIKYQQWIEKAERWVALEETLDLKISVIEAIVEQHFCEAEEQIDHDLKLIEDYETHILSNLLLPSHRKEQLTIIIKQNLSIHLNELIKLKEKPQTIDLRKIKLWKNEVTQMRAHHFEHALHKIDEMIEQISPIINPVDESNEESNQELEMLEIEANTLEKEAIEVLANEASQCSVDLDKKASLRLRFEWLQNKTHPLHFVPHLSTSQTDQLDKINSIMERIYKDLTQFLDS